MFNRRQLPQLVTGYALDPQGGEFAILYPLALRNLIYEPSAEVTIADYNAVGGTVAQSADWQAHGAYSVKVTPAAGVNDGTYYYNALIVLTASAWHAFSFKFKGPGGFKYKAYFATAAGAQLGTAINFTATGKTQWIRDIVYYETAALARRLYIVKDNSANVQPFYVDGLQLEQREFSSTYGDGDQVGFVVGREDFYWEGTPHASPSVRLAACRAGGKVVKLKSIGFNLTAIIGLGLSGLLPQYDSLGTGGSLYNGTLLGDHLFSLVGAVTGVWPELDATRQAFIDLIEPDLVTPDQPVRLLYSPRGCDDDEDGNPLQIDCVPEPGDGLAMRRDNLAQERVSLTFRACLPVTAQSQFQEGCTLATNGREQEAVGTESNLLVRDKNGNWKIAASGGAGQTVITQEIRVICALKDGTFALGGYFLNVGGANGDFLAKYDPRTDTLSVFNATPLNGAVNAILQMPNGNLLIGGLFTNAGGDANADYLAQVNITTGAYSSVNATPLNTTVYALAQLSDGNYAVGGGFVNAGGDANADYLCKLNATTYAFSSFNATPLNNLVEVLARDLGGNLLVGGDFTNAGGDAYADQFARMNKNTLAFAAVVANVQTPTMTALRRIAVAADGSIYIGGLNLSNNVQVQRGGGYFTLANAPTAQSLALFIPHPNLNLGVALLDGTIDLNTPYQSRYLWWWSGSAWVPPELIGIQTTTDIFALSGNRDYLLVSTGETGRETYYYAQPTTVTNHGTANAYPIFRLKPPTGQQLNLYSLKNLTTGRSIFFSLTILDGETVTLDLSSPTSVTFKSDLRGDLSNSILAGSNLDFYLQRGANIIQLFAKDPANGSTAGTAVLYWRPGHHSIDAATATRKVP